MAAGTVCRFSSRRRALTTTVSIFCSSATTGPLACWASEAGANAVQMTLASRAARSRDFYDMTRPTPRM
jgi:hypothetical protein